jgi:polysaccharide export outer membrane protein
MRHLRLSLIGLLLAMIGALAGCETTAATPGARNPQVAASTTAAQLRPGDSLTVTLSGIPDPSTHPVQIDEQGSISLPFLGVITAGGLNTGELSQAIRDAYISRKFYTSISVSVTVTERYVYIGGEVQRPGRIPWSADLTLAKAVQSAGGFTLYAREGRVTLTRDRKAYDFDVTLAQRVPDEDPLLFPGDSIQVPRSAF